MTKISADKTTTPFNVLFVDDDADILRTFGRFMRAKGHEIQLAASVAAARKGEHDIAIGNVIGSNLFNLLGVMALPGVIARFRWRDVDQPQESEKSLQFWSRQL